MPAEISRQLSTADRVVVVTNHFHAFGATITCLDASRLTKTVTSARQDRLPADAVFDWDVEFYAGTNFLTVIHLQDRVFMLGNSQYIDDTGVLRDFWQKLVAEDRAR